MKKILFIGCLLLIVLYGINQLVLENGLAVLPLTSETTEKNKEEDTIKPLKPKKIEPSAIRYIGEEDCFELPLNGATGYATIQLNLRAEASSNSELLTMIPVGSGFVILEEDGDWWMIQLEEQIGYVYHNYCMINLPDVLPSVVYNNTNATSSYFTSSYQAIPNLTGEKLYDAYCYNERLGYEEYIMPVLYSTAKKIAVAQQAALLDGNTLVMYELFRPYEVQINIVNQLTELSQNNLEVLKGLSAEPWSMNWFIATGLSNHQRGFALDVSLGEVLELTDKLSGDYIYGDVTEYSEYQMPTPIHELGVNSISMAYPVTSKNDEAWRTAPASNTMNGSALLLRNYCVDAGLTPLASEWWHFNDLENHGSAESSGNYFINTICSKAANK